MEWPLDQELYRGRLDQAVLHRETGMVAKSVGLLLEANLPSASVGSICTIEQVRGRKENERFEAEVVGFRGTTALLMPFDLAHGVHSGSRVVLADRQAMVRIGPELLGRVIDARGVPMDGLGPIEYLHRTSEMRGIHRRAIDPMKREVIRTSMQLGVRSIDGLITCGRGQRVGIMAGSGVGKSVLLGTMARNTSADINVIALVGERGREVRDFIEKDLGPEGLARSVIVVATSDTSAILRMRAAYVAATIAEYFRDQSKNVLLLMDSVTRFCMAQREIGLAMGEPPATKGYTPSVFSILPKLLERSGTSDNGGSITGLYTVLVEGDELDDPVADSVRSYLDGHIILSRRLAERGHYPAVDVLQSTSRVMPSVVTREHLSDSMKVREWMSTYNDAEDLINIGAYVKGANPKVDVAVALHDRITTFLRQDIAAQAGEAETLAQLRSIVLAGEAAGRPTTKS